MKHPTLLHAGLVRAGERLGLIAGGLEDFFSPAHRAYHRALRSKKMERSRANRRLSAPLTADKHRFDQLDRLLNGIETEKNCDTDPSPRDLPSRLRSNAQVDTQTGDYSASTGEPGDTGTPCNSPDLNHRQIQHTPSHADTPGLCIRQNADSPCPYYRQLEVTQ